MAVFKFLLVLTLAVPLAVFMWYFINKLLDEFQKNAGQQKKSLQRREYDAKEKYSSGKGRRHHNARPKSAESNRRDKAAKPESKRKRRKARRKERKLRHRETGR